jgi:hypothetical protein
MPSQFFGLNIAGSGLRASNAALNTTANNISNSQTIGYSRQVVTQQMRSECLLSTGVPAPVWRPLQLSVSGIRFMISSIGITMRNLAITPQSSIICVRLKIILMMTAAAGLRLYLINSVMPSSL